MVREGNMPNHLVITQGHPDARREQGRATCPLLVFWRVKEDAITWRFELPGKPQGKPHDPKGR
jgi:hypothetical protein